MHFCTAGVKGRVFATLYGRFLGMGVPSGKKLHHNSLNRWWAGRGEPGTWALAGGLRSQALEGLLSFSG